MQGYASRRAVCKVQKAEHTDGAIRASRQDRMVEACPDNNIESPKAPAETGTAGAVQGQLDGTAGDVQPSLDGTASSNVAVPGTAGAVPEILLPATEPQVEEIQEIQMTRRARSKHAIQLKTQRYILFPSFATVLQSPDRFGSPQT